MNKLKRLAVAGGIAILAALTLSSCSETFTSPSMVALRYSGGLGEGGKFKECVKPGDKQLSDDSYYRYPTTQRQDLFDSTGKAADHGDIEVASKDGRPMFVRVNVNFGLNTDCDTLRAFHETIGETRKAYFDEDGSYDEGWETAMNYYITPAVVTRVRAAITQYDVKDLWPSTAKIGELQALIEEGLQDEVNRLTEGDEEFYNRLSVNVYQVEPDEAYQALYTERQDAQTKADTAEANKKAQVAQAEADGAVKVAQAKAEAAARRQAILAYKLAGMTNVQAVRAYNEAQAIASGINPWQPTGGSILTPQ